MYIVESGRFVLPESGIELSPGAIVGELGLLAPGGLRTQSLVCESNGAVLRLGYEQFKQLYFQNPKFSYYFLQLTTGRLFENLATLENALAVHGIPNPLAAGARENTELKAVTIMATDSGHIYAGIGGWNFAPWRGVFYPKGLPHARELAYASEHLTSIEINSTFYGSQKPATFKKWANETPDGFVFALKGPRFATNRRVLAEAKDSIDRFLQSGIAELGDRFGPPALAIRADQKIRRKRFRKISRIAAGENRQGAAAACGRGAARFLLHAGFHQAAARIQDAGRFRGACKPIRRSPTSPAISSMRGCSADEEKSKPAIRRRRSMHGPSARSSGRKAAIRKTFRTSRRTRPRRQPRDAFIYFIHEAKVRMPAAAMALIERVKDGLKKQKQNSLCSRSATNRQRRTR